MILKDDSYENGHSDKDKPNCQHPTILWKGLKYWVLYPTVTME